MAHPTLYTGRPVHDNDAACTPSRARSRSRSRSRSRDRDRDRSSLPQQTPNPRLDDPSTPEYKLRALLHFTVNAPLVEIGALLHREAWMVRSAALRLKAGHTLVSASIAAGRADVLQLLAHLGADLDRRVLDKHAKSPLQLATEETADDLLRTLLVNGVSLAPLSEVPLAAAEPHLPIAHRYWLQRARAMAAMAAHESTAQPAKRAALGLQRLPEVFLSLVGQEVACQALDLALCNHRALGSQQSRKKPLVLLFAGPPGHGKTELATRLGSAIVDPGAYLKISCNEISDRAQMFGTHAMYRGGDKGSELNNFLAQHDGKPALVLLDEFSKLADDTRNGFLQVFEKGELSDVRDPKHKINAQHCIFLLTSNHFDPIIQEFFKKSNSATPFDAERNSQLCQQLQPELEAHYGPPLASRIFSVVPFVPFSVHEAEVLTDQLMRAMLQCMAAPKGKHKHIGHVRVHYTDELVRAFARMHYRAAEGARGLQSAIEKHIEALIVSADMCGRLAPATAPLLTPELPDADEQKAADDLAGVAVELRPWRQVTGFAARRQQQSQELRYQIWLDHDGQRMVTTLGAQLSTKPLRRYREGRAASAAPLPSHATQTTRDPFKDGTAMATDF